MNIDNYFDDNNGRLWNFISGVILVLFFSAIAFVCALGIYLNNEGHMFWGYFSIFIALCGEYVWFRCLINFISYVCKSKQKGEIEEYEKG